MMYDSNERRQLVSLPGKRFYFWNDELCHFILGITACFFFMKKQQEWNGGNNWECCGDATRKWWKTGNIQCFIFRSKETQKELVLFSSRKCNLEKTLNPPILGDLINGLSTTLAEYVERTKNVYFSESRYV